MRKYLYKKEKNYELYKGKMQDVLSTFNHNSIDCVITDPPYELNFMNKGWDNSGVAFQKETWEHCYKVLKPGGYLLAFGGSRTFHRIACAIEDAGFEIRDTIMWLYGSGFPKSMNLGLKMDKKQGLPNRGHRIAVANRHHPDGTLEPNGENLPPYEAKTELGQKWNGWGTCLKPSYEPIIVARKPFKGSLVDNVLEYGVGGLNIDECRVGNEHFEIKDGSYDNNENQSCFGNIKRTPKEYNGRFPANVILTYDDTDFDEVCGGMPDTKSTTTTIPNMNDKNAQKGIYNKRNAERIEYFGGFNDEGNASRYFYCAKASKKDRDEGLEMFEEKLPASAEFRPNHYEKALNGEDGNPYGRWKPVKNIHPTVKPVELMQYLVRLVAPKGGTILDCFMGSGSTGKAVMFENRERNANYKFIGVEMTDEYLPICESRIDYALNKYEYEEQKDKEQRKQNGTPNIFDFLED